MKLYGIVDVARMFPGVERDQLYVWIEKCGCPDASIRVSRKRAFTDDDVDAVRRWLLSNGKIRRQVAMA